MTDESAVKSETLVKKLAEACDAVGGVEKKGINQEQRYKYVRAADVAMAIRHELFRRGIVILQNELAPEYVLYENTRKDGTVSRQTECRIGIEYRITDGTETLSMMGYSAARDSSDKSVFKAKTGALKYFLRGLGLIPDEKEDPEYDGDTKGEEEAEQPGRLTAIVADILAQAPDKSPDVQGMWYRLKEPVTGRVVDLFAPDAAKDSGELFSKIGYRVTLKAIPENQSKDCTRFELQTVVAVTKPESPSGPVEVLKTPPSAKKQDGGDESLPFGQVRGPRAEPTASGDKSQRKQNPNAQITEPQFKRLWAIAKQAGWDEQQVRDLAGAHGWEGHLREMTAGIYEKVCTDLQTYVTAADVR